MDQERPVVEPTSEGLKDQERPVVEPTSEGLKDQERPVVEPTSEGLMDQERPVVEPKTEGLMDQEIPVVEPTSEGPMDQERPVVEPTCEGLIDQERQVVEPTHEGLKDQEHGTVEPTSEGLMDRDYGTVEPTSEGLMDQEYGTVVEPTSEGLMDQEYGTIEPTSEGLMDQDYGTVEPTSEGLMDQEYGTVEPTSEGLMDQEYGTVEPTSEGLKDQEYGTVEITSDGLMDQEYSTVEPTSEGLMDQEDGTVEPTSDGSMDQDPKSDGMITLTLTEVEQQVEPESEEELDEEIDDDKISDPDYHSSDEEESEEETPANMDSSYQSRNGKILWTSATPSKQRGRFPAHLIIKATPGPTRLASADAKDIKSTFELFFPDHIKEIVIKMTNLEGKRVYKDDWKDLDWIDLQAFIGLLILAGVYRSHHEALSSLWGTESGRPIFSATMSLRKFIQWSRVICFDKRNKGPSQKKKDKLAPIRRIWEKWVERLPLLYNPGPNITVDECLVPFRGKCPFRQYIKSKPAKYGVKIWAACDSRSHYAWNMQIYTGKAEDRKPEKNQGMRVVLDMTSGLQGQTVTCDNFFTSYALGEELLRRKMTMIGTVRSNKPELPPALLSVKDRARFSSKFAFTDTHALVSYCPRKNKNVLLMSTVHRNAAVSNKDHMKPEIILDYNHTKGGVDTLDQLVSTYTCRRKTTRWPMVVFYNMLDVSGCNAYALWTEINPSWHKGKNNRRRLFLEELGKALVAPILSRRTSTPRTPAAHDMVKAAQTLPPEIQRCISPVSSPLKRKRCHFCDRKKDTKYSMTCNKCDKPICKSHAVITTNCIECN